MQLRIQCSSVAPQNLVGNDNLIVQYCFLARFVVRSIPPIQLRKNRWRSEDFASEALPVARPGCKLPESVVICSQPQKNRLCCCTERPICLTSNDILVGPAPSRCPHCANSNYVHTCSSIRTKNLRHRMSLT